MFPLSINNYAELSAFIVSALTYRKFRGSPIRLFPFFLLFIVIVELLGRHLTYDLRLKSNQWLYNISTPVEFIFYAYIFFLTLHNRNYKKLTGGFMLLFPLLALLNMIFIQGFENFNTYTVALGSVFIIIFCCLFFYELLLNPVEEELRRDPMFWITAGILFFYLGDLSYDLLFNLIAKNAGDMSKKLFQSINNNLILMLYSCFITGFLCKRTSPKLLSP